MATLSFIFEIEVETEGPWLAVLDVAPVLKALCLAAWCHRQTMLYPEPWT